MLAAAQFRAQSPHALDADRPAWLEPYREPAARLIGEALGSTFAWDRLAVLTDTIGHRLSGIAAARARHQWAVAEMKRDGLENVHTEKRDGAEMGARQRERRDCRAGAPPMVMLGLGNSVGTPPDGVQAEVLVVHSFEELDSQAPRPRGRIVLFNVPFTTTARP